MLQKLKGVQCVTFFQWVVDQGTVSRWTSLCTLWSRVCKSIESNHAEKFSRNYSNMVKDFILEFRHILSLPPKEKLLCNFDDIRKLLDFNWSYTTYGEQNRIQTAFILLAFTYTACHPALLLKSYNVKESGLRYQDCELRLERKNGQIERILKITIRHLKGYSGVPKIFTLYQQTLLIKCSIWLFLTLAIADGAFQGSKSIEALRKIQVPDYVKDLVLKYEPNEVGQPFLWNTRDGPLRAKSFRKDLKQLLSSAGFPKAMNPYSICRGIANKINTGLSSVIELNPLTKASDSMSFP